MARFEVRHPAYLVPIRELMVRICIPSAAGLPARATCQYQHTVRRVHHRGQREPQKVWSLFQEHSISRWIECNNIVKALSQLAAQLHDLLRPMVLAARSTNVPDDDHTEDEVADLAETEVIQPYQSRGIL
jgi:hypothetical protein